MKRIVMAMVGVCIVVGQAQADCPPREGCPTCECPLLAFFDHNVPKICTPNADNSEALVKHTTSVALWGASAIDKDGDEIPDVWRICLFCEGPHASLQDGGSNVTRLVRYFERPWTATGPYWEDYAPVDGGMPVVAARRRSDPKIVVTVTNGIHAGWQALRIGSSTEIQDGNGCLVVRGNSVNYQPSSTDYSDGRTVTYTLDDKNRVITASESVDSTPISKTSRHFVENGTKNRVRKSTLSWSAGGQPQITSTIYGYWPTNPPLSAGSAAAGQLRYVLRPEATAAYLAQNPEAGVREDDLAGTCGLDEALDTDLLTFASMECLGYENYLLTDVQDANQNNCTTDTVNFVKLTHVKVNGDGGCGGPCGASGPGEWVCGRV